MVFVPNLSRLLGFGLEALRSAAVKNIQAQVEQVLGWSQDDSSELCGRIDSQKVFLVGHSAGGAVVFEAACNMGEKISGLLLLDAVPWKRTLRAGAAAQEKGTLCNLVVGSFRAPPSSLNLSNMGRHMGTFFQSEKSFLVFFKHAKHADFVASISTSWFTNSLYKLFGVISHDPDAMGECTSLALEFLQCASEDRMADFKEKVRQLEPRILEESIHSEPLPSLSQMPYIF